MSGKRSQKATYLIEHFMEYHNQGYSITEIAEKFGVTRTTIYNNIDQIAKLNNISRETLVGNCSGRKSSKKTDELIEHFIEYHNQGYSITEIAKKFGVDRTTVYHNLDKIAKINNTTREDLLTRNSSSDCTKNETSQSQLKAKQTSNDDLEEEFFKLYETITETLEQAKDLITKED